MKVGVSGMFLGSSRVAVAGLDSHMRGSGAALPGISVRSVRIADAVNLAS